MRRVAQLAAAALTVGLVGLAGPTAGQGSCSNYVNDSALAAAAGVRTVHAAPGLVLTDADGSLPAAQAQIGSRSGSTSWAGAPYSSTAAGNAGFANTHPNDVPVFAVSSYPTEPEARKSTPAATIEAKTGPQSAAASVVGGGPTSGQLSVGRVTTSADSSCDANAVIQAVADNRVEMINIQGVLRIGSVRSHAKAVIEPSGNRILEGTMQVEGATVLGQPVAITDRGVLIGPSTVPTPGDPLAKALAEAGISVRSIAAAKNPEKGEVFAPGLEVVVTRGVQGVGTGPATSTYTLGRAHARATGSPGELLSTAEVSAIPDVPAVLSEPSRQAPSPVVANPAPPPVAAAPAPAATLGVPADDVRQEVALPASRIANASNRPVYAAMGAGVVLLSAAWLLLERLGGRLRWR